MTTNEDFLNELNAGTNSDISYKNCFRIVVMGKSKTGKSQIVNWLLSRRFDESYCPTIEDFHIKIFKIKGETYRLEILDTSGNDPFPAVHKLNIMSGDLFILPFSLDDIDSYNQVKHLCQEIREIKKTKHDKYNYPILILGNKLDWISDGIKNRCVDTNYIEQFASTVKSCIYGEVSCKTSKGLEDTFTRIFTLTSIPIEMLPSKHRRVYLKFDISKPTHNLNSNEIGEEIRETSRFSRFKPLNETSLESTGFSSNNFEREGSFKSHAMKNIKRMTFRRTLNDARGVTQFNARRPSIQTELNLLQIKSKSKNQNRSRHTSRFQSVSTGFRKLFCIKCNDEDTIKKRLM